MCKIQITQGSAEGSIAIGRNKVDAKPSQVELSIWWIVNSITQSLKASTFFMMEKAKSYAEE